NQDVSFIANDAYFGPLLSAGVGFYDESAKLTPMFEFREPAPDTPFDFDNDSEITGEFEFDDLDEEYFDSVERDDEDTDETSTEQSEDDDGVQPDHSDLL